MSYRQQIISKQIVGIRGAVRYFTTKTEDPEELNEVEIEHSVEFDEKAAKGEVPLENKKSNELMTQYKIVPVAEHPLFPKSSQAL